MFEPSVNSLDFNIYPDPSTGKVTLEIPSNLPVDNIEVKIFDSFGKILLQKTTNKYLESYDLSGFSKGVYQIVLSDQVSRILKKIVII